MRRALALVVLLGFGSSCDRCDRGIEVPPPSAEPTAEASPGAPSPASDTSAIESTADDASQGPPDAIPAPDAEVEPAPPPPSAEAERLAATFAAAGTPEDRLAVVERLAGHGRDAYPALLAALADPALDVAAAAEAAAAQLPADAVPYFRDRLARAQHPERRAAAARALKAMGATASSAAPALARALGDADDAVRYAAAEALVAVDPDATAVRAALTRALDDVNPGVQQLAAEALAKLGAAALPAADDLEEAHVDAEQEGDEGVEAVTEQALDSLERAADAAAPARSVDPPPF